MATDTKAPAATTPVERLRKEQIDLATAAEAIINQAIDEGREYFYPTEAVQLKAAGYDDAGRHYGDKIVMGRIVNVRRLKQAAGTKAQYAKAQQAVVDTRAREAKEARNIVARTQQLITELKADTQRKAGAA